MIRECIFKTIISLYYFGFHRGVAPAEAGLGHCRGQTRARRAEPESLPNSRLHRRTLRGSGAPVSAPHGGAFAELGATCKLLIL